MVIYIELCCFTIYPTAILSAICIEFSIHELPANRLNFRAGNLRTLFTPPSFHDRRPLVSASVLVAVRQPYFLQEFSEMHNQDRGPKNPVFRIEGRSAVWGAASPLSTS